MILCQDCVYCEPTLIADSRCHRPVGINIVDGGPLEHRWAWCQIQREDNWLVARTLNTCGKSARFFTPKPDLPQVQHTAGKDHG